MTSGLSCSPLHVQDGQTALYIASWKGHDQIVELLLRREADVNHQTKVRPLMLVCVCVCSSTATPYIVLSLHFRKYMHNHVKVISRVPSNKLGYKHQGII